MRNFETPKMNISMFAAENVATTASGETPTSNAEAANQALKRAGVNVEAGNVLSFNYGE